uniref:Uncharacterized protein n=1 Tax=Lactuca sativa TaxID=4236 RepID=A0A9R1WSB3_LACSA|nr:hypothetical protein LSAT_V11C100021890 [Lactuca sativa]
MRPTNGIQMWIFGVGRSPMCQRSTVIILGLLRTMNRYEVEVCQLKMCLLASWVLFPLFLLFWNLELELRDFLMVITKVLNGVRRDVVARSSLKLNEPWRAMAFFKA